MKRTLALTLTVAMVGGLMFMGFAGTAAAQDAGTNVGDIDVGDIDQDTGDATAVTDVTVDQNNNNAQVGVSSASADAGAYSAGSHDTKDHGSASAFADATAVSSVNQDQTVVQNNNADVDATSIAVSGDNSVDIGHDFGVDGDA